MGMCRTGLAVAALAVIVIAKPVPSAAASAALSIDGRTAFNAEAVRLGQPAFHRHRAQSFYCYPKNYWWFYRPYTTGLDGHARCMPYFHYLGPGGRRGKADDYIK
jgi:hypothetical protein